VRNITLPETDLRFAIKTTIGVHPQNTSALSIEYVTDTQSIPCMVNQTLEFPDSRRMFVSDVNDSLNVSEPLAFSLIAELSSDNANISPVIDTAGMAAYTIENEVDIPSKDFKSDFDLTPVLLDDICEKNGYSHKYLNDLLRSSSEDFYKHILSYSNENVTNS
jgi:hypothetical protein